MATKASSICAFIAQNHQYVIDRRVISLCDFSLLRRNLLMIIKALNECETDDATGISKELRRMLSEWITTPSPFDEGLSGKLKILMGEPGTVSMRWPYLKDAYAVSLEAAKRLSQHENPIRLEIRHVINDLIAREKRFKIYCHKNARQYFESIMHDLCPDLINGNYFIHKPKDYRSVEPFDVLIKVGPFRSRGWGSCPDALLTAPRFETVFQFVWSGSRDEPGFGRDPVTGVSIIGENFFDFSLPSENSNQGLIPWKFNITQTGDNLQVIDEDEFLVFQTINKVDKRNAVLLHIDEQYGILYPFREKILSFNPVADSRNEQIGLRSGDLCVSGAFLILPIIAPVDFGELHAKDGAYSLIWKKRLSEEIRKDHSGLCKRLFDSGIKLIHLFSRLEEWSNPPKTVILAPQKVEHFRILIDHLGIEDHVEGQKQPWWQYAWKEIRRSKGEAISEGRIAQDLLHEHSLKLLISLQEKIHEKTKQESDFYIRIPEGKELQGHFRFCKIIDIEKDFWAPDSAFREINDLREFEQWRG